MNAKSPAPATRAARCAVAVVTALLALPLGAQDEAPPAEAAAQAPAAEVLPTDDAAFEQTTGEAAAEAAAPESIPVQASEAESVPESTELDTVQVTGSRLRRTDYETAQPVITLTREDIERTGLTNVGEILQKLPAAGSALNRLLNNGGTGATEIDLRNLGSQRVLVLVDGHRWVSGTSFASTSAVDLNTVPVSIVERIEVLKDGASALYGSDAITGVVNIITRKDFVGAELRAHAGSFAEGDGATQNYSLSWGNVSDQTSMFIDLNFVRQAPVFAGNRPIAAVPKANTGLTRGSLFTPRGTVVMVTDESRAQALNAAGNPDEPPVCASLAAVVVPELGVIPPAAQGAYLCFAILREGETVSANETMAQAAPRYEYWYAESLDNARNDAYNYAPINYLATPFDQASIYTQLSHRLFDNVAFNSQILLNTSKTERALAETPLLFGNLTFPPYNQVYVDATNLYNPFDQDIGRDQSGSGVGPGTGIVARRFVETGPRFVGRDVKTLFFNAGLTGDFVLADRLVDWEAGFIDARSDNFTVHRGDLNMDRVKLALGPDAVCQTTPGCVPLNLFGGPGTITQEMLDYIQYDATSTSQQQMQNARGSLSLELPGLAGVLPWDLLADPIGVAVGGEWRDEFFTESPDPFTVNGTSSTNLRLPTAGGYSTAEGYVEVALPLLADKPFVEVLDLSLAARYVSYNTFGDKTTGKLGLRYKPIESLLLRGTLSQAFRAPAVTELYLGTADGYPVLTDPCAGADRAPNNNIDNNCNEDSAPSTTQQLNAQVLTRSGGNPDLTPETADSVTAGLVWSPTFLPDFNFYIDWFSIRLDDAIGFYDAQFILDSCYTRADDAPRPETCDLVVRNPDGSVAFINNTSQNIARIETSGVEVAFDYVLPVRKLFDRFGLLTNSEIGTFKLAFDSSYLDKYDQYTADVAGNLTRESFAGTFPGGLSNIYPRFKANLGLTWSASNWEATWLARYIGSTTEDCLDPFLPTLRDLGVCSHPDPLVVADDLTTTDVDETDPDTSTNEIAATFYHNVQVGYTFPQWGLKATFGVINVFDQDPPVSYSAFANSFPGFLYEVPGMQPYLRIGKSF